MRIAIPKGRLQTNVLATFAAAGYQVPTEGDLRSRRLVFQRGGIEWILVKDCDVPIYVQHGAADAGVAGLDQILEHECTAYQPVELPYGRCRMMLIGSEDAPRLEPSRAAKIATKYPRIARRFLEENAIRGEIVPLGGSVELAAVLSLTSHVIDLVETGETVRIHRLQLQQVVAEITPRLIVSQNVYRTDTSRVRELIRRVEETTLAVTAPPPRALGWAVPLAHERLNQENSMIRINTPEAEAALRELEARRNSANENASRVADELIAGVRSRGDACVAEQIERFDRVSLPASEILIEPRSVAIDRDLAYALDTAIDRIDAFHRQQLPASYRWSFGGTEVIHRVAPLRRVGIYAPGGRAVYVSTILMCAVPARIAGVEEIVVATPPGAAGRDELHYVCRRLGIREIYRSGGAAAIAALALGTETLRRVDFIAGPGNSYVTAAKARLIGEVGIDMTAGPTELVVIADETADPALVQADLDAQQEHGADSAVICISIGQPLNVRATLSLLADSVDDAVAIADRIAPEHLAIHARDAASIAQKARNAGAIYCGPWSAPAAGDYVIGSNHVLPTSGTARFFSPLGVYDFVKRTNLVTLSREEIGMLAPFAAGIARFEGLPAHAASVEARNAGAARSLTAEQQVIGGAR